LEVVLFELTDIRVILLLSNLDTLVPSVEFLIHCHRFLNFIVLNENGLGLVELFIEDS
jgi:hypothetical protein